MRTSIRLAALAVSATAAITLNAGTAAAATVNWKEVDTNSNWHCSAWEQHWAASGPDEGNYNFKPCIVVNSSGGAQGVLVIQNASIYQKMLVKGAVRFPSSDAAGQTLCAESVINNPFTRGCFAPTKNVGCGNTPGIEVLVYVKVDGEWKEDTYSIAGVSMPC
ncbi:hypothetical protein GTY83_07050 [Streptomyces sp. SID4928]|uniref:hypothetical protein n=1 Tax=Streptomyces TaxID=1883 RepID=UPI0001C1C9A7|nr:MULTISPECIES: hypothetical protein [Streptomyces]EGE40789.1 hypothetical protein SACT1_1424 [Streptomyces sp. ACT-1]MYR48862.1 hypothetical protein [Streptomyces sp. SID4928]